MVLSAVSFKVWTETLTITADRAPQFIDITEQVEAALVQAGIAQGMAVVYSRHTTAAIKINEHEPELLKDMEAMLGRIAPQEASYFHNNFFVRTVNMEEEECPNGHSHCQHLLLSTSETVPVVDGRLALGRYQRIFLVELDRPRERQVVVQVMGT
jgi:secondary thiamine-phosphate synthase enzyme